MYFVYAVCTALQNVPYHFCLTLFCLKVMLISAEEEGGVHCFLQCDPTLFGYNKEKTILISSEKTSINALFCFALFVSVSTDYN